MAKEIATIKEATEFIKGMRKTCRRAGFKEGVAKSNSILKKMRCLGENTKGSDIQEDLDSLGREMSGYAKKMEYATPVELPSIPITVLFTVAQIIMWILGGILALANSWYVFWLIWTAAFPAHWIIRKKRHDKIRFLRLAQELANKDICACIGIELGNQCDNDTHRDYPISFLVSGEKGPSGTA